MAKTAPAEPSEKTAESAAHEGHFDGKLSTRLFYRWRPASAEKAVGLLVFVHGLAEHSGRYEHVFARMGQDGFHCFGFDLRGHGHSGGRRVYLNRFSEYIADVHSAVARARELGGDLPLFIVGHSMGGLVALTYLLDHPDEARGGVLSSPGLANKIHVPAWKDALGKGLSKIWPTLGIPTGIGAELVSRDVSVVNAYDADPLVTSKATARWYTEMLAAQVRGMAQAKAIKTPVLVLAAGQDKLTDTDAMKAFVAAVGGDDKTLQHYPELYHEVFNEPEKESVFLDVVAWLKARAS